MQHHEVGAVTRLARIEEVAGCQSLPRIVVTRPGRDAMDIGDELRLRLRGKLRPVPEQRMLDRAVDVEPPALARYVRGEAEVEGGPVAGQMLPRRQTLLVRARCLAGEETALMSPALLAT